MTSKEVFEKKECIKCVEGYMHGCDEISKETCKLYVRTDMKIKDAHIYWSYNSSFPNTVSAKIDVEGLGEVIIDNCLSDDLRKQIESEAIFTLKQRLNIKDVLSGEQEG